MDAKMEVDFKHNIKTEPTDNYEIEEQKLPEQPNGLDNEVVQEFSVVMLCPNEDTTIGRMLFEQMQPRKLDSCTSRIKQQVKHVELTYKAERNSEGNPKNEFAALYDGIYNGENSNKSEPLLRNAVGFFKSGRFYVLPLKEAYEMRRKINKAKQDNEEEDVIDQNKLEDAMMTQFEVTSSANPVRVSYGRNETEWQKKRREQSAQYKQQIIENDPWIDLQVKKTNVRQVFKGRIENAEHQKPAMVNSTHNLPVL